MFRRWGVLVFLMENDSVVRLSLWNSVSGLAWREIGCIRGVEHLSLIWIILWVSIVHYSLPLRLIWSNIIGNRSMIGWRILITSPEVLAKVSPVRTLRAWSETWRISSLILLIRFLRWYNALPVSALLGVWSVVIVIGLVCWPVDPIA